MKFIELEKILSAIDSLPDNVRKVRLISALPTSHPEFAQIVTAISKRGYELLIGSTRADTLSELPTSISVGDTVVLAPEAGTDRLRRIIGKGFYEKEIISGVEYCAELDYVKNVSLYFILGLPTETEQDREGIVKLVRKIKDTLRPNQKVTLAIMPLMPQPHTPYQRLAMLTYQDYMSSIKVIREELGETIANLWTLGEEEYLMQVVLNRGDERVGSAIYSTWQRSPADEGINLQYLTEEISRFTGRSIHDYMKPLTQEAQLPWYFITTPRIKSVRRREDKVLALMQ
jgi:radical SAM superfamily enzyme YgiQ (UPF0313 family)